MPRRPPREYYENDSYDSDDRDRLPRRRPRREREAIIDDDPEPRRRRHSPPLEEMERLRIRERSVPDHSYDEFDSREPRRRSPRRRSREIERDDFEFGGRDRDRARGRRKYVERSSDEDDMLLHKGGGGWKPTSAGYTSDEESIIPERRRRKEVSEWDYERRDSPPRTRGRGMRRHERSDSDEEIPMARGGWKPSSAGYASDDDDEFIGRSRRMRKEVRSSPDSEYGWRDPFPHHSARDELEMEYGVERGDFRDRAGPRSRSRSRSWYRDNVDEIRIQKDVRGRHGRRYWKDDRDDDDDEFPVRKRSVSPSVSPRSRVWSPDRAHDRHVDDGYDLSHPPRAPSPEFRSPRVNVDELDLRSRRRRRSPENAALREWGDRPSSPPIRRISPERDEWEKHEDISMTRRPRSPERKVDAFASEWDTARRGKTAVDLEEDTYHRRGSDRLSSHDSTTDDWAIVDAPPRPRRSMRSELDGVSRELSRKHYHSRERRLFPADERTFPDDDLEPQRGQVGRRYVGARNPRDRLWTEITKDLVVREAIERSGYEFEETDFFYYIFEYLQYEDVSALVDLSDDIRHARRRRIHEIHRERTSMPPPLPPAERRSGPLLMDRERVPSPRLRLRDERERPRLRDREMVVEDSRRRRPLPPRYDW
ncbi:hypothetical protein PHISCL_03589 [Aspergillus sclerotialis]|uniref:DUF8035 domain-containing protein n=1 Tax=Aspergillus sclerotialis TaxID=2070753 RepID=A0A3A2ZP77_9EURO|nr:hypothetical protein PHISCL_03589 [Aspergillus sclerotialis]